MKFRKLGTEKNRSKPEHRLNRHLTACSVLAAGLVTLPATGQPAKGPAGTKSALETLCKPGEAARQSGSSDTTLTRCWMSGPAWDGVNRILFEALDGNAVKIRRALDAGDSDNVVVETRLEVVYPGRVVSQCMSATLNMVPAGNNAALAAAVGVNLLGISVSYSTMEPAVAAMRKNVPPIHSIGSGYPALDEAEYDSICKAGACAITVPPALERRVLAAFMAKGGKVEPLLSVRNKPVLVDVVVDLDSNGTVTGQRIVASSGGVYFRADRLADMVPGLDVVGSSDLPPIGPCSMRISVQLPK